MEDCELHIKLENFSDIEEDATKFELNESATSDFNPEDMQLHDQLPVKEEAPKIDELYRFQHSDFSSMDADGDYEHNEKEKNNCQVDVTQVANRSYLIMNAIPPFTCIYCADTFVREEYLIKHLQNHQIMKTTYTYKCSQCRMVFSHSRSLFIHKMAVHRRNHLEYHQETAHPESRCEQEVSEVTEEQTVPVDDPNQDELDDSNFPSYKNPVHPNVSLQNRYLREVAYPGMIGLMKLFQCTLCEKVFACKASLYTHLTNIHKVSNNYKCIYCDQSFDVMSQLISHQLLHPDLMSWDSDQKQFMEIGVDPTMVWYHGSIITSSPICDVQPKFLDLLN